MSEGGESATTNHPLDAYASNLNELARQGRIDPLVGVSMKSSGWRRSRPPAQEQPAAGGRGGVGKTAIAEGLAKRIVDGQVPALLADSGSTPRPGALPAGTKYRGDFEKRQGLAQRVASSARTRCCSSTRSIPSSAPVRHPAG